MIDTTLAPTPETTPVPETKEEYLYTTKKGKIKKFRTKEAYDNYLKRLEKLKVAGRSGGRPPNELERKSDTMQSGEGSSTSNSALQLLTNDEEKKRIESEKKTTDTTAKKKKEELQFQQTVLVIAILIVSIALVLIFFMKPLKNLFGGSRNDSGTT